MQLSLSFDTSDIFKTDNVSTDGSIRELEERLNNKMAMGMKKAMHFFVGKFDFLFENKMKMMVKEELDMRMKEIFLDRSNSKTAATENSKSRRKRNERIANSTEKSDLVSKIPRIGNRIDSGFTPTSSGAKLNYSESNRLDPKLLTESLKHSTEGKNKNDQTKYSKLYNKRKNLKNDLMLNIPKPDKKQSHD